MEFLIIWIACGVICAVVAPAKGRSGVGWLFIGLATGVIGVIILAMLPKAEP